jgi:hypothetical protein
MNWRVKFYNVCSTHDTREGRYSRHQQWAIVSVALAISVWFFFWVYKKVIERLQSRKVRLTRKYHGDGGKQSAKVQESFKILKYFELDHGQRYPEINLESLGEYVGSLSLQSSFNVESILISVLERFGYVIALPLALFLPRTWRKKELHVKDLEKKILPFAPESMIVSALSTKSLGCLSEVIKELGYGSFAKQAPLADLEKHVKSDKQKYRSMELLGCGSNPKHDSGLHSKIDDGSGGGFVLCTESLKQLVDHLVAAKCPSDAQDPPKEIHPALEGLYFGNQGLGSVYSIEEEATNAVASSICNKLAANALRGTQLIQESSHFSHTMFTVIMQNESVSSLENFFDALERSGHVVSIVIRTNITSMGVGLSAKCEDGSFAQIPLAYPLKTGLSIKSSPDSLLNKEAITLMTHGACFIKIEGPLFKNVELEWCLNVTGFTGFQPVGGVLRPWQADPKASVCHNVEFLSTRENRHSAFRLMTVISCVTNLVADSNHIVLGGYGYMGVCLDSIAVLQQALTGSCTMYPLFLGGAAKMNLLDGYRMFQDYTCEYDKETKLLMRSLISLPCDLLVEPRDAAKTARRALAALPEKSIFKSLADCKRDLHAVIELAERVEIF